MSVMFPPAMLVGLEMAALILWAPGIFWFFLQENLHAHKILRLGERSIWGVFWVFWGEGGGGAEVPILFFFGHGDVSEEIREVAEKGKTHRKENRRPSK